MVSVIPGLLEASATELPAFNNLSPSASFLNDLFRCVLLTLYENSSHLYFGQYYHIKGGSSRIYHGTLLGTPINIDAGVDARGAQELAQIQRLEINFDCEQIHSWATSTSKVQGSPSKSGNLSKSYVKRYPNVYQRFHRHSATLVTTRSLPDSFAA